MIYEDQVFIVNVLVIDPTWDMVAMNAINQLTNVATHEI
jgi:hypothetical protein